MSEMSDMDIKRLNLKKEKVDKVAEHLRTTMDEICKDNLTYTDSLLVALKIMQQYDPTECNDSKVLLMEVSKRAVDAIYGDDDVMLPDCQECCQTEEDEANEQRRIESRRYDNYVIDHSDGDRDYWD